MCVCSTTGSDFWFDQNQLHCSQLPQHSHSQNVTPWRYYCSCKTKCFRCSSFWWPTCPRLSASQSTNNCHFTSNFLKQQQATAPHPKPIHQSHQSLIQENLYRMSNGNCSSPAMSASPVPAPPPPQPRMCPRACRFVTPDTNHLHSQQSANYSNPNNSYTGKWSLFLTCSVQLGTYFQPKTFTFHFNDVTLMRKERVDWALISRHWFAINAFERVNEWKALQLQRGHRMSWVTH